MGKVPRLLLIIPVSLLASCNLPSGKTAMVGTASIPATGHKAKLTIHFSDTGYFMGQKQGEPHQYPDGSGTLYWTANQSRTEEYVNQMDSTETVRSCISDTGALCYWRWDGPKAIDKTATEYWIKGGTPLPGGLKNAWVGEMPFCALGLSRDFIMQQLQASREIALTDRGARVIGGVPCHGIQFAYTGRSIPGSTPSEIWFSDYWQVPWRIQCTRPGGAEQWIVEVAEVADWTPAAALLRLAPNQPVNRLLKE